MLALHYRRTRHVTGMRRVCGELPRVISRAYGITRAFQRDVPHGRKDGAGGPAFRGAPLTFARTYKSPTSPHGCGGAARSVYGVVASFRDKDDPETIEINYKATEYLREKLKDCHVYRHIDLVKESVLDGIISVQEAKSTYGVIMSPSKHDPETLLVDYPATQKLRKKMMIDLSDEVLSHFTDKP